MADPRGGYRVNAGRKKKPPEEKKKPKKYKEMVGVEMPEPSEYLSTKTKGTTANYAKEVFVRTWQWLVERDCDRLISVNQVEQYAMCVARWIQAEEAIHTFGFLAKHPTTGMPIASPYVKIAQDFVKQSSVLWTQIYGVIRENCIEYYNKTSASESQDMMEILLSTNPNFGGIK